MLSAVARAALESKGRRAGHRPKDGLAAALAWLGRAFMARDS
jgi:hypothetical protein